MNFFQSTFNNHFFALTHLRLQQVLAVVLVLLSTIFAVNAQSETDHLLSYESAVKVNINTADVEELSTRLYGVGESKAIAIIDYREQMGSFTSINDLVLVKGIGETILTKNRHLLSVTNE